MLSYQVIRAVPRGGFMVRDSRATATKTVFNTNTLVSDILR